jgi:response regulator RpfG family c-di-GMP phosphodiesterase
MELLRRIKELSKSVRTILMTAFDIDDKLFQEYCKRGIINRFVQKPIGLQALLNEISDQLHYYETQKHCPS